MDFLKASLIETKRIPQDLLTTGMTVDYQHGLVYPNTVFSQEEIESLFEDIFPNLNEFKNTFHKSWEVIENTPQAELWTQAIIHYFTTYGLESMGIDNDGFVYVPDEIDCTPELRKFRVIGTISPEDLLKVVADMFVSGVALKQQTIDNYLKIVEHYPDMTFISADEIKNKEVRTMFLYKARRVPHNGEDMIRLLNYTLTGRTMLVKDEKTFQNIAIAGVWSNAKKKEDEQFVEQLLTDGARYCAETFYRNKPIFLAIRQYGFTKEINKIRRLAKIYWQPRKQKEFLSTQILNDSEVTTEDLEELSVYDLVKIYNKLNYIVKTYPNGGYHDIMVIRNGSIFVKLDEKTITPEQFGWAFAAKEKILDILAARLNPDGNRQIILPKGLDIAFPTSEKSFIGDIPLYSQMTCEASSVVGIAWDKEDLDLSALLEDGGKVGWNSHYSDATKDVLYSGDQTRGGAEALYFNANHSALVMLNVFYGNIKDVNLFISNEKEFSLGNNDSWSDKKYIYDPNNIIYSTKLAIDGESKVLGLYDKQDDQTVFTFVDMKLGSGNVSRNSESIQVAIEALKYRGQASLKLSDIFGVITPEELEEQLTFDEDDDESDAKAQQIQDRTTDLTNVNKADILELATLLNKD